ncbi:hypothetical protein ABK040_010660 [Willaertia magna]
MGNYLVVGYGPRPMDEAEKEMENYLNKSTYENKLTFIQFKEELLNCTLNKNYDKFSYYYKKYDLMKELLQKDRELNFFIYQVNSCNNLDELFEIKKQVLNNEL